MLIPVLIHCAVLGPGESSIVPCGLAEALADRGEGRFVWIDLEKPTAEECQKVGTAFGLHDLVMDDSIRGQQRPKFERYGDKLLMVLKPATYDAGRRELEFSEVQVFVGVGFVVTIRHGRAPIIDDVRAAVSRDGSARPEAVLHGIADRVVDGYVSVLQALESDIGAIERSVFGGTDEAKDRAPDIYELKRQVLELWHNSEPLVLPLDWLSERGHMADDRRVAAYFCDVADHLKLVVSRLERLRDLLSDALDANLARLTVRQNEDIRRMSAWGALFLLPTILIGLWGMNFRHMPELDEPWGYPAALAVITVCCLTLYWRLRRTGWL